MYVSTENFKMGVEVTSNVHDLGNFKQGQRRNPERLEKTRMLPSLAICMHSCFTCVGSKFFSSVRDSKYAGIRDAV